MRGRHGIRTAGLARENRAVPPIFEKTFESFNGGYEAWLREEEREEGERADMWGPPVSEEERENERERLTGGPTCRREKEKERERESECRLTCQWKRRGKGAGGQSTRVGPRRTGPLARKREVG